MKPAGMEMTASGHISIQSDMIFHKKIGLPSHAGSRLSNSKHAKKTSEAKILSRRHPTPT